MMDRRQFLGAAGAALLAGCDAPIPVLDGGFTGINVVRGHAFRDSARAGANAPATTRRAQVVIAGGGVAGLAAARALRLRGVDDFVVLELEDGAGGNSRAGQVNGIACPLGAHYLPVPSDDAHEVQDLLEELGLRKRVAGRWQYDERHLCHSPQERLFFQGAWQEGLLPVQGVGADTLAQYRKFSQRVAQLQHTAHFRMPAGRAPFTAEHQALDAVTFATWLDAEQLTDTHLRWYLDYCCRDDFGAGAAAVSAWAGIHYFASRHGFHAPGDAAEGPDAEGGVLTWPEGNGWLTRQLSAPLGARIHTGSTVLRIRQLRHGVEVDVLNHGTQTVERWQAQQCIVALPVFIAARVVENPPDLLVQAAARMRYAPWLVANIHIDAPLQDHPGAAPAWDNVVYGETGGGLGYVDARHQTLDPRPAPSVLTYYQALGDLPDGRRQLLERPWTHWRDQVLAALAVPHPDLPTRATRMEITRYGHAMSVPVPGTAGFMHKIGLQRTAGERKLLSNKELMAVRSNRLQFAHADWSGYSVFEEAFTRGHVAGMAV